MHGQAPLVAAQPGRWAGEGAVTPSTELIRNLAVRRPGTPALSVYVRTDPRDPGNTARRDRANSAGIKTVPGSGCRLRLTRDG
jgi:hypothetical protein